MDRLSATVTFFNGEMNRYRAGKDAFLMRIEQEAAAALEAAGGIGPFVFEHKMADGNVSPHQIIAREQ